MRVFDTKAHKKTERAQKRQFIDTKAHKKTEKHRRDRNQKDGSFLTPRPTRRQKEHRRDRTKQTNFSRDKVNRGQTRLGCTRRCRRKMKEVALPRNRLKEVEPPIEKNDPPLGTSFCVSPSFLCISVSSRSLSMFCCSIMFGCVLVPSFLLFARHFTSSCLVSSFFRHHTLGRVHVWFWGLSYVASFRLLLYVLWASSSVSKRRRNKRRTEMGRWQQKDPTKNDTMRFFVDFRMWHCVPLFPCWKQINFRWEFSDPKAHKKTERAQKRQKQSKLT